MAKKVVSRKNTPPVHPAIQRIILGAKSSFVIVHTEFELPTIDGSGLEVPGGDGDG